MQAVAVLEQTQNVSALHGFGCWCVHFITSPGSIVCPVMSYTKQ